MSVSFLALLFLTIGIVGGWLSQTAWMLGRYNSLEMRMRKKKLKAQETAHSIIKEAHTESRKELQTIKNERTRLETEFKLQRQHLNEKEQYLEQRSRDIEDIKNHLDEQKEIARKTQQSAQEKTELFEKKIELLSGISKLEAQEKLFDYISHEHHEEILHFEQKLKQKSHHKLEQKAKEYLASSIQRLAVQTTKELTSATIHLEHNDIKGKIIGKEGRNIKALERATEVEYILHETEPIVTISSYDPLRREIAKQSLKELIEDGRIHPAKIEEVVQRITDDVHTIITKKGIEAVKETEIFRLPDSLIQVLGQLSLRTSYGQNVLKHSIEVSHLAGMLAEELGANVLTAKAAGLLHDIGKALDHNHQGGHVTIGMKLLHENGIDIEIINAMKSHHDDYPHESIESIIVQTADMISAARPGARKGTTQQYLHRLANLEQLTNSFEGIEKSYIISGGREIRAFVNAQKISDHKAKTIAKDIAKRIEKEMRYPGEITVTVIRESRITTVAR